MIGDLLGGCFEEFGHWVLGVVFGLVGFWMVFRIPGAEQKVVVAYLAGLLLHTSVMLLVGFGLKKLKKVLAITWLLSLTGFFIVAALFAR